MPISWKIGINRNSSAYTYAVALVLEEGLNKDISNQNIHNQWVTKAMKSTVQDVLFLGKLAYTQTSAYACASAVKFYAEV